MMGRSNRDQEQLFYSFNLEEVVPAEVSATFIGPKRAFYFFDPTRLKVVTDASTMEPGRRTVRLSEQNVQHPQDLTLQQLSPASVRISVRKNSRENEEKAS